MIARLRASCLALLIVCSAAPISAQVVGHLPEQSPFVDATGRHIWSGYLGYLTSVKDPAGVGPGSSVLLALQYDYDFPSPFFLTSRVALAPFSDRAILDPLFDGPRRNVGSRRDALVMLDAGLAASLTGEKAWRGIAPRVFTNIGLIGSLNPDYDIGQYRFGPKLTLSYGLNVRGVTGKDWEWRADVTRMLYRMNYPSSFVDTAATAIINGRTNPWGGQTMLTVGISRLFGR